MTGLLSGSTLNTVQHRDLCFLSKLLTLTGYEVAWRSAPRRVSQACRRLFTVTLLVPTRHLEWFGFPYCTHTYVSGYKDDRASFRERSPTQRLLWF